MKTKQELLNNELLAFDRAPNKIVKIVYRKALVTRRNSLIKSIHKYRVELEAVEDLINILNVKYGEILAD